MGIHLILYSKPGCHLCEGLQEKLAQVKALALELEVRDITTRADWFEAYQYEIPVLCQAIVEGSNSGEAQTLKTQEMQLPRLAPRASVVQLEQMLQKYLVNDRRQ